MYRRDTRAHVQPKRKLLPNMCFSNKEKKKMEGTVDIFKCENIDRVNINFINLWTLKVGRAFLSQENIKFILK